MEGIKKGIMFDLDGTLWDSSEAVVMSWNEVLEKYEDTVRPATVEWMQRLMGKTMLEIENAFLDYLPPDRRHEVMQECMDHENEYIAEHGGILFPDVRETLALLKKEYHLSVVSNCQEGYIPAFFKAHGMEDLFDDYEEYGRTGMKKAGNIRLVKERNGLTHAVYLGDILGDYEAASEAGISFIHAAYGYGQVPKELPRITRFCELPEAAAKVFERMHNQHQNCCRAN